MAKILGITAFLVLAALLIVARQGFLPSNERSKFASIQSSFKTNHSDIQDYLKQKGASITHEIIGAPPYRNE